MAWPVITSKLMNQDKMPCRVYSNSRRSTWPGYIGKSRCLHPSQLVHTDGAFALFGLYGCLGIDLSGRNLLNDASRFQFVSDLPPRPLADWASRLGWSFSG
jgi:hypothetical protein